MNYAIKTTNKSFINMWRYLQRNNITNNIFMLQTNDKDLLDFSTVKYKLMDKSDDNPEYLKYKAKIVEEAKNNIWFYFRELVMVPDEDSISGYKHFELTPESMICIYLYEKEKSFIKINNNDDICLQLIWNLHKSLYNTDLVLINDENSISNISNNIKKYIANMECQVPLGSTQIISDDITHFLKCDLKSFKECYWKNNDSSFLDTIKRVFSTYFQTNSWVKSNKSLFILEKHMPLITYSYIINLIKDSPEYRIYLNGIENNISIEKIILCNFLKSYFQKADDRVYDINETELNSVYLI